MAIECYEGCGGHNGIHLFTQDRKLLIIEYWLLEGPIAAYAERAAAYPRKVAWLPAQAAV